MMAKVTHILTPEKEKTVLVGIIGVLVLVTLVWFSQDFPAQGQAIQMEWAVEQQINTNVDLMTDCNNSCELVDTLATLKQEFTIYNLKVNTYELTFYDKTGKEIELSTDQKYILQQDEFKVSLEANGLKAALKQEIGVDLATVGHLGKRYPAFSIY